MAEGNLDVLVVGGGITGCGVALDAASRGHSVGLLEGEDFAWGTSGRSSRLVHGGLRYLANRELGLVRESLRERRVILRNAPHLVRPLEIVFQASGRRRRATTLAGFLLYDALGASGIARTRRISAEAAAAAVPGFGRRSPAFVYTECATDDARLTLAVARTAAAHGALVANHARVEGLLVEGRVTGARVRDTLTGETFEVRARTTVNATGIWSSATQALAVTAPRPHVTSKGVHVVFRPGAIRTTTGAIIRSGAGDGRLLFTIPWEDRVYVGTTDTGYGGTLDEPAAEEEDVAYVVDAVAAAFPGVGHEDVVATWAGLRPLAAAGEGATADLSRRHEIYEEPPGLITVTGGKLTTYRAMAAEVVDRIAGRPLRHRLDPARPDASARGGPRRRRGRGRPARRTAGAALRRRLGRRARAVAERSRSRRAVRRGSARPRRRGRDGAGAGDGADGRGRARAPLAAGELRRQRSGLSTPQRRRPSRNCPAWRLHRAAKALTLRSA